MTRGYHSAEIAAGIARLPQWAQDYIGHLRRLITERDATLKEWSTPLPEGQPRLIINPTPEAANQLVLPIERRVRWEFERDHFYEVYYSPTSTYGGGVHVYSSQSLVIRPEVTNVVRIDLER